MPNSFTPQQIEQFLQEFFDVVGARQYVGARYVPIFGRAGEDTVEWDDLAPYEPLTVVMHQGVSYVSRRYVPTGIQITDTDYWVETYRFNAQVEQYRQEVLSFQGQIDRIREDYVPFPDSDTYPKYGLLGQVLTTLTNGATKWEEPVTVTADVAEPLIEDWLDAHPEATTSVQDRAITRAKLNASLDKAIPFARSLPASTDLNDFDEAGYYPLATSTTYTNAPTNNGRRFLMVNSTGSGGLSQILIAQGQGVAYTRMRYDNVWHDWSAIAVPNGTITREKLASGLDLGTFFIRTLPVSTDLDDFTSMGYYPLATNTAYTNAPTNMGRRYLMAFATSDNSFAQILICQTQGLVYTRMRYDGVWHDWSAIAVPNGTITREKLASALDTESFFVRSLPVSTDLDDFTLMGYYPLATSTTYENAPTNMGRRYLLVITTGTIPYAQILVCQTQGLVYSRMYYDNAWHDWQSVTKQLPTTIRVCSYNIGLYSYGHSYPIEDVTNMPAKDALVRNFIYHNDFDVMYIEEFSNRTKDGVAAREEFSDYYKYFNAENAQAIASKFQLSNVVTGTFTDSVAANTRYWRRAEIYVNGHKIALFGCHLAWQNTPEAATVRNLQKQEIIDTILADYDYAILFGDWNAYDISEYDIFTTNGFKIANNGYLGAENTQPSISPQYPLDNVVTKGDIFRIAGKAQEPLYVPAHENDEDYYVSDHIPYAATITIY